MKLWLLKDITKPTLDSTLGFVIAAHSSREARKIAEASENSNKCGYWLNAKFVTCRLLAKGVQPRIPLTEDTPKGFYSGCGIILEDYLHGL